MPTKAPLTDQARREAASYALNVFMYDCGLVGLERAELLGHLLAGLRAGGTEAEWGWAVAVMRRVMEDAE